MAFSSVIQYFQSFIPGQRLVDGGDLLAMANILFRPTTGIVAFPGGIAAGLTPLKQGLSRVDTVGTAADAVQLPPAIAGGRCLIWNNTSTSMTVYGQQANQGGLPAGDQVCASNTNVAAAVAVGVAQAGASIALYTCFANGVWKQFLTA